MKNEKLLPIIISLLSLFVIAAGIYINLLPAPEPHERFETPERQKPVTVARDPNEEIDISKLSPAYNEVIKDRARWEASDVYYFAEDFLVECDDLYVTVPAAPYKGVLTEHTGDKPEIKYGTKYTKEGTQILLNDYLEYAAQETVGAYVVAVGEGESPVCVYYADSFDSGYIGYDGENIVDTEKFTTLNAVYDELLRMYEEEPEKFNEPDDYYDSYYDYDSYDDTSTDGAILNIYSDRSQIEFDIEDYYLENNELPEGVAIDYTIVNSRSYEDRLTDGLFGNTIAILSDNDKVDLFILDPVSAKDILNSDYVLPLSELGFTEEELSDQFPYTVSLTSDDNGVQKGLMYKLYPEVFIYRKSIAKSVLGTDDPKKVAEFVKDRESFEATAEKMKEHRIKMLADTDNESLMYIQSETMSIDYENGDFVIPENWKNWAEHTKDYLDKGFILNFPRYSVEWGEAAKNDEFFGIISYSSFNEDLMWMYPEIDDDWAVCPGPVGSYSHGMMICAAKGTDNPDLAADIMRTLALDKENLKSIAQSEDELTNTVSGMTEIAEGDYDGNFGGGYNPFWAYTEAAKKIGDVKSYNDPASEIIWLYKSHMKSYFAGENSYEECVKLFQSELREYWFYP
jgi:hypothetical protein